MEQWYCPCGMIHVVSSDATTTTAAAAAAATISRDDQVVDGIDLTLHLAPPGFRIIPTIAEKKREWKEINEESDIDEATGLDLTLCLAPLWSPPPPQHPLLIGFNNNVVPPLPNGDEQLFTIVKTLEKSNVIGTKTMEDNVNPFFTEEQKMDMYSDSGVRVIVRDVNKSLSYPLKLKRLVKSSNSFVLISNWMERVLKRDLQAGYKIGTYWENEGVHFCFSVLKRADR